MKIRSLNVRGFALGIFASGLAVSTVQARSEQSSDTPNAQGQHTASSASSDGAMPKISVSTREPASGGADGRVSVGGVMISRPRFDLPASSPTFNQTPSASNDGTISVPLNTVGPGGGETLQQRNERISAENRRLEAEAAIAEREAARPAPRDDDRDTVIVYGPRGRQVYRYGGRGFVRNGTAFTESVTRLGGLHDQAQSHFGDAASAGTGLYGTLPQDAQRHINAASQPNLSDQQRARDEVQRNLQTPPKLPGAAD